MTTGEREVLVAAMDRVLPAGAGVGATAANAIGYVEWLEESRRLGATWERLRECAALLDSLAAAMWATGFAACSAEEQDAVLARLQATPHPTTRRLFAALVQTTLAGFLCPPEYGGNRNGAGWREIGCTPHSVPAPGPGAHP
jgi:hypothetical protein